MRRTVLALLALLTLIIVPVARAAEEPLPPQGASPPGANNFSCKPPARHPFPIVLVHGTFGNQTVSWQQFAPDLTRLGYCVFALDYGNSPLNNGINAVGDIPKSARQLKTFIDKVLAATHASKVSIVGHSQGGMMPRYYIKFLGGLSKVDDLVGLSPSSHGTTSPGADIPNPNCPACNQQADGSPFMQKLNAGDQTPAPVDYSVIETRYDEVVTPYTSEFLPGPSSRVTNRLLQDLCPTDMTEHVRIIYDSPALQLALNALGRPGPLDPKFRPNCTNPLADRSFPDSSSVAAKPSGRRITVSFAGPTGRRGRQRVATMVHAIGGRARVRVSLQRVGGKYKASSGSFTVRSYRRFVIGSRQLLRPGRYILHAFGRDANGRPVNARRTVRLR